MQGIHTDRKLICLCVYSLTDKDGGSVPLHAGPVSSTPCDLVVSAEDVTVSSMKCPALRTCLRAYHLWTYADILVNFNPYPHYLPNLLLYAPTRYQTKNKKVRSLSKKYVLLLFHLNNNQSLNDNIQFSLHMLPDLSEPMVSRTHHCIETAD